MCSGILRHLIYSNGLDFIDLHRAVLESFFFERKGHLKALDIGHEDAKWGVIKSQISYQIKNIYPKNILYNPLHHWTFLHIRMSIITLLNSQGDSALDVAVLHRRGNKKWGVFMYGRGFKSWYNSEVLMPDGFEPS